MSIIVGEVVAPIRGDTRPFQRDLVSMRAMGTTAVNQLGSGMKSFSQALSGVGKKITQFITLPLVGAGVAVFKLGKDFESEMSKITGLVGVGKKQVNEWGKDILDMAPKLGKAPKELGEALFFVTSAGLRGAAAMNVLRDSGKASASGLGETATIADLVTSAMNAYGQENLSSAKATDILVAAVREGKAEASELAASMGQVLPLASELSVSFDQVAATQAAMTKTGTSASEAATQLKSIMAGLIKPSKQAEEQLDAMGTSSSEMRKKIRDEGLLSALMDLREMTNKYGEEAMARVFPNIRALMGVLDLMGSNLEGNKKTFAAVKNSVGSLDKAFQSASETVDFKWNAALGKVQSVLIGFFGVIKAAMIPALEIFIKVLDFVSKKFNEMSPLVQKFVLILAGMAALVGPAIMVVAGVLGSLAGIIAVVSAAITGMATIISGVGIPIFLTIGGAILGVIAAFAALALQIGIAIGFIVGSFVHLWNTNDKFREKAIATWNSVKENAKEIFTEIKNIITYIFNGIKIFWNNHGNSILKIASIIWTGIFGVIRNTMNLIKNIVKLISAIIQGDWRKAWASIKGIVTSGKNIILSILRTMGTIIGKLFSVLGKQMVNNMRSAFKLLSKIDWRPIGVRIVSHIISGMFSRFPKLKATVNKLAKTIRNSLPFSPAKEGPLRDLDKLNFGDPISKSLNRAKMIIESPLGDLGNSLLTGLNGRGLQSASGNGMSGNYIFYGDLKFEGVRDVPSFMEEMRKVVMRHGGRNSF